MADALGSSLSASLAVAAHYITPQLTALPPVANPLPSANLDAPIYVNPSVSFNATTDVVFLTYRNDAGKITEQYPPSQVVSRYQSVDETGMSNPILPRSTPNQAAGPQNGPAGNTPPPTPPAPNSSTTPAAGTLA